MPKPAKDIHDYQRLARDSGLVYGEIFAPSTVWVKVRWLCETCGREMYKPFHSIQHQANPCRCQNGVSIPLSDYEQLGQQYGLTYVGTFVPHNTHQVVAWQTEDGRLVEISYRDLKYKADLSHILNPDLVEN